MCLVSFWSPMFQMCQFDPQPINFVTKWSVPPFRSTIDKGSKGIFVNPHLHISKTRKKVVPKECVLLHFGPQYFNCDNLVPNLFRVIRGLKKMPLRPLSIVDGNGGGGYLITKLIG